MTPSFSMRLLPFGILIVLAVAAPSRAHAQRVVRVEVHLDSVVGTAAEVPAAQAELGLRAGLRQTGRLSLLPLPGQLRTRHPSAAYRVDAMLWVAPEYRTLRIRVVNVHDQGVVRLDSTRSQSRHLADSAAALGRRAAILLANRSR